MKLIMSQICDKCKERTVELFHPVNEDGDEIYPDLEFCESCALQIEDMEYEKRHPIIQKSEQQFLSQLKQGMGMK